MIPRRLLGAEVWEGTSGVVVSDPLVDEPAVFGRGWVTANPRTARVRREGIATFVVDGGREVVVDVDRRADQPSLEQWLHGPVAALVLGQQGGFAAHASAVTLGRRTVVVVGGSGAGKSTAALALCAAGWQLVADDVSPLEPSAGSVCVVPYGRSVHLWPDTLERFALELPAGTHTMRSGKLVLPPPAVCSPAAVHAIAVLRQSGVAAVTSRRLPAAEAVATLTAYAFWGRFARRLWPGQLLDWAASVAAAVAVWEVRRPRGAWSADQVAGAIARLAGSPGHAAA